MRRRALLRRRLADQGVGRDDARGAIPPRPVGAPVRLSHAQERMWFFHQLDPRASAYNVCILWRLTGRLDAEALRTAFDRICDRHEVLRTIYPVDGSGAAYQHVLAHLPPEWADADLSHLDGAAQEPALAALAREAGRAPFDLTSRSPLHLTLVRLGADRHALVMVGQHITWDGPAFGVFSRELGAAYADVVAGKPGSLPALPVQYGDFAVWHRQQWGRDGTEAADRQLAYWRDVMTPAPEPLTLPVDVTRTGAVDEEGGWCTRDVDGAVAAGVLDLAAAEGATAFMVLAAGIATLLGRWCGAEEATLGTVIQNRDHPDLAPLIGNLANTVPLRVDLGGRPTFRVLLRRVREVCTGAYAHADVPFDRLLDELGVTRHVDRSPLFDVTVVFLAQDMESPKLPGLDVTWEKFHNGTAQTDLSFDALLLDGRLGLQATYRSALFRPTTVAGLLARLEHILAQAVADPDRPVHDIDLVLPAERALVTGDWAVAAPGAGAADAAPTVGDLFEAQVARSGTRPAVDAPDGCLTFDQLDRRANRIARLLVGLGAGPEETVAVALPRGVDALAGILGVLKSGAAYVPLDPRYPVHHLSRVLEDARPTVVLTASGADVDLDALHAPGEAAVVRLGDPDIEARLTGLPDGGLTDGDRRAPLKAAHPAMVIFTSGSTGRPKGVVVPHAGLVNLFHSHRAELHRLARDRTGRDHLQVGHAWSFAFDASWQPQLWLLDGHTLHVLPYDVYADPEALAAEVVARGIDFIELTPSLLDATLDHLEPGQLPAVVGFGGEAVAAPLWDRLAALPATAAFNLYGPTEATVDALVARVAPGTAPAVGHPVAGTRVAVLDRSLHPVPPGMPGELYIGGAGVARGYAGRPDLTAERFVADPLGPPGTRAYRSGDRVRWRHDGELEFLGRADDQVKVRGFRVEPAEIEAALRRITGGRPAVVVAREDRPGDTRLVGYVVTGLGDGPVDTSSWRAALAAELPAHLVPSAVVTLDRLPLLPNGKVDRTALPAPAPTAAGSGPAPRTPAERALVGVVAEVLGIAGIGVDDDFFEFGGDSILAIQLVGRARRVGLGLRPRDVFTGRTVRALAAVARTVGEDDPDGPVAGRDDGPIGLAPLAAAHIGQVGPVARFAQSVLVHLPRGLAPSVLTAGLQAVLDRHDALRSSLGRDGDRWVLDPSPPGAVVAASRLRTIPIPTGPVPDDLVSREAAAAAGRLDPAGGVVVQAVHFDPGPDAPGTLLLVAHHLVVDGVSWRIVVADLADATVRPDGGRALDPVPTSPQRWSRLLAALAGTRTDELAHWRSVLDRPDPTVGARPLDPDVDTVGTVRTLTRRLAAATTDAVSTRVPRAFHAEIDDVLLTGLTLAMGEWRHRRGIAAGSLLVDVEGHGRRPERDDVDLSRTVGWLTSLHPLALALDPGAEPGTAAWREAWRGGPAVGRALKRVKEQRRSVPRDGLGFGALAHVAPDHGNDLDRLAPPQVGVNHLGRFPTGGGEPAPWSVTPRIAAAGETFDPDLPLAHALELTSVVEDTADGAMLTASWAWPAAVLDAGAVAELADLWFEALAALAHHAERPGAGGRTPSDLPLVALTQPDLDRLEASLPAFEDLWPLTPLQEVMLGQARRARSAGAPDPWTSVAAFTLDGSTDPGAAQRAADDLVGRLANLRAGFEAHEHVSFVAPEATVPWAAIDLRDRDPGAAAAEVARLEAAEQARPFDLARPPLLHGTTVALPDGTHRVVLASHHLLLDGWSVPLALGDLLGLTGGTAPPARPSYRSFLYWLDAQDLDTAATAWAGALQGVDAPTLVAPGSTPAPTVDRTVELPAEVTRRLAAQTGRMGATLNAVVQAAWALVLARLTGRRDIVFGAFTAGRSPDLAGMEDIVGLLLGIVPVRLRPASVGTAADLVAAAQDQQALVADHPHVRVGDVAARLGLADLFDTLVVFESFPGAVAAPNRTGVPAARDVAWSDSIGYPLGLFCYPGEALGLRLCHDPAAVDAHTLDQVTGDLVALLGAVADDPAVPVDDLLGGDPCPPST